MVWLGSPCMAIDFGRNNEPLVVLGGLLSWWNQRLRELLFPINSFIIIYFWNPKEIFCLKKMHPTQRSLTLFGLKKGSLITQFSSLITQFSSLIAHHSSLKTPHPVWHHHSFVITQYFSTICGFHTCTLCIFYFIYLLFFLQLPVPKLTELVKKKKKKKKRKKKKKNERRRRKE